MMENELYSICWNLTNKCNENCKFCYRKLCSDNIIDENLQIFDKLSNIKIGKITLCGGEPLLYNGLFELATYTRNKWSSILLSITTNGSINEDSVTDILRIKKKELIHHNLRRN